VTHPLNIPANDRQDGEESMRGRVLGWDNRASEGLISGEDGQRYRFARPDWRDDQWPERDMLVDFQANETGAGSIFVLGGSGAHPAHKDKIVAALLAFFLGGLGIHKFYLGKAGAGITMLLCGTIGWLLVLPGLFVLVVAFAEFIIYLTIDDKDFHQRYVQGNRAWF
jgi:TM2 domain-containing membrane protein YozV